MYFKTAERHADTRLDLLLPTETFRQRFAIERFGREFDRLAFSERGLARFAKKLRARFGESILAAERPTWSRSSKVFRLRIITDHELQFVRDGEEPYSERCALFSEALFFWRRGQGWRYAFYETGSIGRHCMARIVERGIPARIPDREAAHYLLETLKLISQDLTEAVQIYDNAVKRGYAGKEAMLPLHGGVMLGTHTMADSGLCSRPGALKDMVRLDLRTFCHGSILTERQNEGFVVMHHAIRQLRERQMGRQKTGGAGQVSDGSETDNEPPTGTLVETRVAASSDPAAEVTLDAIVDPVLDYYLTVRGRQSPFLATRMDFAGPDTLPLPEHAVGLAAKPLHGVLSTPRHGAEPPAGAAEEPTGRREGGCEPAHPLAVEASNEEPATKRPGDEAEPEEAVAELQEG